MRAYDLDGASRSAHRTSAASMTTVRGPSGAIGYGSYINLGLSVHSVKTVHRTLFDPVQNGFGKI